MTIAELAQYFNEACGIGADLTVVPMEGWRARHVLRGHRPSVGHAFAECPDSRHGGRLPGGGSLRGHEHLGGPRHDATVRADWRALDRGFRMAPMEHRATTDDLIPIGRFARLTGPVHRRAPALRRARPASTGRRRPLHRLPPLRAGTGGSRPGDRAAARPGGPARGDPGRPRDGRPGGAAPTRRRPGGAGPGPGRSPGPHPPRPPTAQPGKGTDRDRNRGRNRARIASTRRRIAGSARTSTTTPGRSSRRPTARRTRWTSCIHATPRPSTGRAAAGRSRTRPAASGRSRGCTRRSAGARRRCDTLERCLELAEAAAAAGVADDWDVPAALEGLARAQAVAGDRAAADATRARARHAVAGIADPEDRQLIEQDLETTPL